MAEETDIAGEESQAVVEAETEPKAAQPEGDPGPTAYPVFNNRFRVPD